jgi:hypothetical protein
LVDLEAEQVDVHRLDDTGRYGAPERFGIDGTLTCLAAPQLRQRSTRFLVVGSPADGKARFIHAPTKGPTSRYLRGALPLP